tara:strand:+ start:289 stop:894 length:606 start_codon:yes stop_codon:yes gene_type:complete
MKKLILLLLFIPLISFGQNNTKSELIMKINAVQKQVMAQGNITEEEEQTILSLCSIMSKDDGLANYSPDDRMILKDVEIVPVYYGCEDLSREEIKKCFNNKVSTFIKREFNLNVSKDLKLLEPKEVEAFFIINEKGNLTGMKVRNSELTVQAEILRVLRKMPVMKPAVYDGKSVSILCSIRVKYGNEIEIDVVYIPERPNN